ncbi:MAG: hypothetical protein FWE23_09820 [Chitinivibrionia bacterium]|nr:hypothetical protein [Chitinivibrionia bacterium]
MKKGWALKSIVLFLFICGAALGQNQVFTIITPNTTFVEDSRWDWENTGWGRPGPCDEPRYTLNGGNPNIRWSVDKNADHTDELVFSITPQIPSGVMVSVSYRITANSGVIVARGQGASLVNNPGEARAYIQELSGGLLFSSSSWGGLPPSTRALPLRIIDHGDNRGDATFTITFTDLLITPRGAIDLVLPEPITFTILSDDKPRPEEHTALPPTFTQNRVIEFFDWTRQGAQSVGRLIPQENSPCHESRLEILSIRDVVGVDVRDWFTITDDYHITTNENFRADFENLNHREITFSAKTIDKGVEEPEIESEIAEFIVKISPWNDHPFDIPDYFTNVAEGRFVNINVLQNYSDPDLPSSLNRQRIIGLSRERIISDPVLNIGNAFGNLGGQQITTALGANVEIIGDGARVRYDLSGVEGLTEFVDTFFVIALDTALYSDHVGVQYETDSWIRSVKITVNIAPTTFPPTVSENLSFYYDTDGDGKVEKIVIPFDTPLNLDETRFSVSFAGIDDYVFSANYRNTNGIIDSTYIHIYLTEGAPQDSTSGAMTVRIEHLGEEYEELSESLRILDISINDGAAPVIVSAKIKTSFIPGESDILSVVMSEDFVANVEADNQPFMFKNMTAADNPLYSVRFYGAALSGREGRFTVNSAYNSLISEGDSIFINSEAEIPVKDFPRLNGQRAQSNKKVRVYREVAAKIISAAYFDIGVVRENGTIEPARDGYIDRISVDLGMPVSQELAEKIAFSDYFQLAPSRNFTINGVSLIENGFELHVVEAAAIQAANGNRAEFPPRTSTDERDVIQLKNDITFENITIRANVAPLLIKDNVAPVILRAYYIFSSDNPDTTLEVVFSEPVELRGRANTLPDSPYSFYSRNQSKNYNMIFENSEPVRSENNSRRIYNVASSSIPFPVSGDSLWVMQGGHIFDADSNEVELTVRAPLILSNEYADNFELWVVPQPLRLVNVRGRTKPAVLDEGLARHYQIPIGTRGVALIVEAMGPVRPNHYNNRGTMRIINSVGNVVRENIEMKFVVIQDGDRAGNVVGVAVWDGKNDAGRFVAAATYLALIDVSVQFYDRPSPVRREFRRQISVSSAGTGGN